MKILMTGGAGFIGSAVVKQALAEGHEVINVDCLTYAANLASLADVAQLPGYAFAKVDICNRDALAKVFADHTPDAVMHLAAESHVDRSIDGPEAFVRTNVLGTFNMLDVAHKYWLQNGKRDDFRFHHISTDEVFGSLGPTGQFDEETRYDPRSPYSASKASSDHFVRAWHETYGLPVILTNCSNNYGPRQFPEKLIPLTILNALRGEPLPVYGAGLNVRDWLHVDDHATALLLVLEKAPVGETFAIGGNAEAKNIDIVHSICRILDAKTPGASPYAALIKHVKDRPGHDLRYAINATRIRETLGWTPSYDLETGLEQTVDWYLHNAAWWEPLLATNDVGNRLGHAK